ncbi:MAG: type VI secretion system baseplate subunit TssG [Pseudomonadota bacterium]|nr:type VI secretion system baseplate subunit TssG [Pseudomonadota bacterium]
MASDHRPPSDLIDLTNALQREPFRFDFLQTLRHLEALHPDKPRLGDSLKAADDPVRLGQEPATTFAPATIERYDAGAKGRPPRMLVHFLGLLGPNGPLPLHLTEYARDRSRNADDPTFARFLDVFNHRMLTLFYRAWAQGQPTVSFDRPETDRFGVYLGALFGIGMRSFRNRDAMPDLAKLHYTGHLSCQARHADGLRSVLGDFLKLPVAIEEFIGHWLPLPRDCHWRLGESPETGSLGMSATVGSRVWDRQYKFRIHIGPLSLQDYERLLPGGDSLARVTAIVRNYVGDQLTWNLNLILKQDEVPPMRLGAVGRLGWTTWVTSKPLARDGDELLLDAMAWHSKTAADIP